MNRRFTSTEYVRDLQIACCLGGEVHCTIKLIDPCTWHSDELQQYTESDRVHIGALNNDTILGSRRNMAMFQIPDLSPEKNMRHDVNIRLACVVF